VTQKSKPSIASAATAAPMPIPALAPVLSPLPEAEEAVAVGVTGVDVDDEADTVVFGFC
jgi:hypothetical protein